MQDDELRAKLSDDVDFWSKHYQSRIDDISKQAKDTLKKAQDTADQAIKLYDQKCRPILEPQKPPALHLFRVGFMCSNGDYLIVDWQGNGVGAYYRDGSPIVDGQGNNVGVFSRNCPSSGSTSTGMNGSGQTSNPGGNTGGSTGRNGLMKSMIPTGPFVPRMPETGNSSHGAPGTTPTQTINTTIGAPVIK